MTRYPLSRSIIRMERYQQSQSFRDRFPYLTEAEAASLLNVDLETVQRLVEIGTLVDFECGENLRLHWHKRLRLVRRIELETLQQQWQAGIALSEVSQLLNVSEEMVLDLVYAGLLTEVEPAVVDDGDVGLRIDTLSFSVLTGKLRRYPPMFYNEPDFLPLTQATQLLEKHGYDVVQVIQHVVSGDLKTVWLTHDLHDLQISKASLEALLVQV